MMRLKIVGFDVHHLHWQVNAHLTRMTRCALAAFKSCVFCA